MCSTAGAVEQEIYLVTTLLRRNQYNCPFRNRLLYPYSYRKASIGFSSAAFFAGRKPKIIPTNTDTEKAIKTENMVTLVVTSVTIDIEKEIDNPKNTPIRPPVTLRVIASIRN